MVVGWGRGGDENKYMMEGGAQTFVDEGKSLSIAGV
jgi:hypothetical protein